MELKPQGNLKIDPNAKILLITTFQDEEYIGAALNLGCKGYILKQNIKGIIPAINAVYSGNMVFDSKIVSNIKRHTKKIFLQIYLIGNMKFSFWWLKD